jgi:hypothetical protein|tara:strand:+ start:378 stop:557 length:180 start_codon:yes stop_codon:yes gene_type:complete
MKTEFKRLNQKLTVWGNCGTTVNLNMTSEVPYEEPQDIEVDLTNEEVKELIKTLQSLVL